MSLDSVSVSMKTEAESENECDVSEAAAREDLYPDHEVKLDLVLGPVTLQKQDAAYLSHVPLIQEGLDDVKQESIQDGAFEGLLPSSMCSGEDPCSGITLQQQFRLRVCCIRLQRIHVDSMCKICHKVFKLKSDHSCIQEEHETMKEMHAKTLCHKTKENICFCDTCGKEFVHKDLLIDHIKMHTVVSTYSCKVCNAVYKSNRSLKLHTIVHKDKKAYFCHICDKQFTFPSALRWHKHIHTGNKPHCCKICNKKFLKRAHIVSHMRIHTGEKPFRCEICKKQFTSQSNLTTHKQLHTGDKKHLCEICRKQFYLKGNLAQHMHIHTGERN